MAKKQKDGLEPPELPNVEQDLSLYDLTDLFHAYYRYHNDDYLIDYQSFYVSQNNEVKQINRTLSRFESLRRIEACRLGSRPFMGGKGLASHKPNSSLGYMRMLFDYLTLPYKSVFTDSDLVKIQVDRRLYQAETMTDQELDDLQVIQANNPTLDNNKEISDDTSDAFVQVLRRSNKVRKCINTMPLRIVQDGLAAFVHSDVTWQPTPVQALDLITEPQVEWDSSNWSSFFVIRKMTAHEAVTHIRKKTPFWNTDALRWSLENAQNNRGLLNKNHYNFTNYYGDETPLCGENFTVKSFYSDKAARRTNIGSYYGNMLVVEAYYLNKKGKVNKAIFFPSEDFLNISSQERTVRDQYFNSKKVDANSKTIEELNELEFADTLFHRTDVFDSMQDAVTVIPFDVSELVLERQRGFGHELFAPIELTMRLDSSILNLAILMGIPFYRNRNQGTDAQDLEDLEINMNGDMIDLGDRAFEEAPFQMDLNGMLNVRGMLLQHIRNKAFLGGLDGMEMNQNGRGADLANLRLIRDGRVHKHNIEDFAQGLTEFYTKIFREILNLRDPDLNSDEVIVQKLFYDTLEKVHGYDLDIFEFDSKDVVSDTGLPYWMQVQAIRNGASHFGAAELVLYSEIKQVFGDGLDQKSLQALNRMGIKSLLGSQDALDILGDPKDQLVTEKDQIYRATTETTALIGSVHGAAITFETIPVLDLKDDHIAHLREVHNPKAQEIIERIANSDVTPDKLAELSEEQLETRNNLILMLAAISNHSALHLAQLDRFGSNRKDVNQIKEETNAIMQSAEGLLNSLQLSLRALITKREEQRLKMQNLSPENEAERMKQEKEMMQIQAKQEETRGKLALANKIAEQRSREHMDKQLSKARDRKSKEALTLRDQDIRMREAEINRRVELAKAQDSKSNNQS